MSVRTFLFLPQDSKPIGVSETQEPKGFTRAASHGDGKESSRQGRTRSKQTDLAAVLAFTNTSPVQLIAKYSYTQLSILCNLYVCTQERKNEAPEERKDGYTDPKNLYLFFMKFK